ncbi:MAG: hypothetical protein KatS3mg001_220 [Candidatus Pacearchaeota archaeon]|nr:MAG: hypothetical protein KatS3mg001_220 [Candidatus Pacearchaeota archaeon]
MQKRKKLRKEKNFFKKNFLKSIDYMKDSKDFIYSSILIFFIFSVIGAFFPTPKSIELRILEILEELLKLTEGMNWQQLTKFIFFNNLKTGFYGFILGVFLGVFSVIVLIVNGYILGYVSIRVIQIDSVLVLWKLFPHGIFELPAIFISTGLGIRLGSFIFQKDKIKSFKFYLISGIRTFIFVVIPLLIIAAIIESTLIHFF